MKMTRIFRISTIRLLFWIVAITLGLCQTWAVRHTIFSDGISYLDIATTYLAGDFHNAINPYWSPLYSWAIAVAFLLIHPSPYWQVATLHLVNFSAYVCSLGAFEVFLAELLLYKTSRGQDSGLPATVLYVAGYCSILFAGLSLIGIGYCSPDMIAMFLMLVITTQLMRIRRTGGTTYNFLLLGIASGLFFLARTAFAPTFVVCWIVALILVWQKGRPLVLPAAILTGCFLVLTLPFIAAISMQTGHLTIGEAGKLNYGWEVAGASRFAHWQGEPNDIGTPMHSTKQVSSDPKAYVFTGQVPGTYSPWYNPAFWYDGIKPKIKLGYQLKVIFVNLTVLCNLLVRSPVSLSALLLVLFFAGVRQWWPEFLEYWVVLLPSLSAIGLYCIVYLEKRYVAGNFVILWMALLCSVRFVRLPMPAWLPAAVSVFCLLYTGAFVIRRQTGAVKDTAYFLLHHREEVRNINYMMAEKIRKLGLQASDRVAVIGAAVDADWARIDGLKIVGEIPLTYNRNEMPFNNTLNDSTADIKKFWTSDDKTQQRILNCFRAAGAKLVIADAYFSPKRANRWPGLLDPRQPGLPKPDPETGEQVNFRYLFLTDPPSPAQNSRTVNRLYGKPNLQASGSQVAR